MNKKDSVIAAICHHETGFVPYTIELVSELQVSVEERLGIARGGFSAWVGNCVLKAGTDTGETIAPGYYRDEYGVVWNRTVDKDIGNIENILIPEPTLDNYTMPATNTELARSRMTALLNAPQDAFKVFKIGSVLYERAWFLRGFENLLTDFYTEPAFVHKLMDAITERYIPEIEAAMECGADGLYLGDDYGSQLGLVMSPDTWRTFIKPYLARLMAPALSRSKPVMLHSCGNITQIMPDLIDMGLSVYQTVQPEVYNLKQLKAEFGAHMCFFGAIGTQSTLPHETPEKVRKVVLETCRIMGQNGGYICGPTHKVTADTPPENIIAMAEVLINQNV